MKTQTQINRQVKTAVVNYFKKYSNEKHISYTKKVTRNDEFYNVSEVSIFFNSTCVIGEVVEVKLSAEFNNDTEKVSIIQY